MPNKDTKYYATHSWDLKEDNFSEAFYQEFVGMTWSPNESAISEDKVDWQSIEPEYRELTMLGLVTLKVYKHFIGSYCLPALIDGIDYSYSTRKSVLAVIMERLLSTHSMVVTKMVSEFTSIEVLNDIYTDVVDTPEFYTFLSELKIQTDLLSTYNLQKAMKRDVKEEVREKVGTYDNSEYNIVIWKELALLTMTLDVCYLPVFYAILMNSGDGRFKHSRETIQLIYRDISIATTYLSSLANEYYQFFDAHNKLELEKWLLRRMDKTTYDMHEISEKRGIKTGISVGFRNYLEYTFNKTLFKLGFDEHYKTTTMPKTIEKAMMLNIRNSRYRFAYTDPDIKISWWNKLKKRISNLIGRLKGGF